MAEENKVQIDNTALVEAIAAMRANFKPETQNKVINLTLKASFFIPATMTKNTELVANAQNKLEFKDKNTTKFMLIENPEKGKYFPCFTDLELLKSFVEKHQGNFRPFAMKFADLATITEMTADVNGFIINPNREGLPYTKEMLAGIKSVLMQQKAKVNAAQSEGEHPNITVTTNNAPEN